MISEKNSTNTCTHTHTHLCKTLLPSRKWNLVWRMVIYSFLHFTSEGKDYNCGISKRKDTSFIHSFIQWRFAGCLQGARHGEGSLSASPPHCMAEHFSPFPLLFLPHPACLWYCENLCLHFPSCPSWYILHTTAKERFHSKEFIFKM